MKPKDKVLIEKLVRTFLDQVDLDGADFDETPRRVSEMWDKFLNTQKPDMRAFPTTNNMMVTLKDYIAWGFCPHHLLPVEYTFKIGYIPQNKVIGLSKLARLADYHLSCLPLQENLPQLIVNDLHNVLEPLGVGCQVRGKHLCVCMRGVKSPSATFVTTALRGMLLVNPATQQEFLTS